MRKLSTTLVASISPHTSDVGDLPSWPPVNVSTLATRCFRRVGPTSPRLSPLSSKYGGSSSDSFLDGSILSPPSLARFVTSASLPGPDLIVHSASSHLLAGISASPLSTTCPPVPSVLSLDSPFSCVGGVLASDLFLVDAPILQVRGSSGILLAIGSPRRRG